MLCPACHAQLQKQQDAYICPERHGVLITSKHLIDIESDTTIQESGTHKNDTPHEIVCPHCAATMHKTNYNSTNIIIDVCMRCHYRWLDAGEFTTIKHFKPQMRPEDLFFLLDVDRAIEGRHTQKDANPRLPIQGWWRGIGSYNSRIRLSAIGGQGLYAIAHGLAHSKTSRYLVLATLLVFGLLFFVVFTDFKHTFGL